jgi:hypothetical protein
MAGKTYNEIMTILQDTYLAKNHDYGDSFGKTWDEFGIVSAIVRMSDKLERLKMTMGKTAMQVKESRMDTLLDLANYAIMSAMKQSESEIE